jgi:hypothetical protein
MCCKTLLWCLAGLIFQCSSIAQNTNKAGTTEFTKKISTPAKNTHIVNFSLENGGLLHIFLDDGADIEIPLERGRFNDGSGDLRQEAFKNVQLAEDGKHIGWLAAYMICSQNYPCNPELVIYQPGKKLTYIYPPHGVIWGWQFAMEGKQVTVHYGFPHGDDTGVFTVYSTETGREAGHSSPKKKAPK